MQTQKDLVTMHDRHAIMNIDVLSFVRLAYRIFEETGAGTLPVLDDEGKNLILRKIAGNHENELQMLRGNIRKLGYISEVKSVLSEFAQYDIGEEEIDRVMENAGRESRLYYKLADMKVLYRGFQDYLKERYISKEELFQMFNLSRPQDFEGHSLSVSDVIALKRNGEVSVHYVDSIGFKELPGFLDTKPERPSVLMNLKEKCDAPECNPTVCRKARADHEL